MQSAEPRIHAVSAKPRYPGTIETLLQSAAGRALLRRQHTCIQTMNSARCIACNNGTPYPHQTIDEMIDGINTRPAAPTPGREPCLLDARPAASTPGQENRDHACPKCGYNAATAITATYTFLIGRDPPSLNRRMVNTLKGGKEYRREKTGWIYEIRAARLARQLPYAHRAKDDRSSWPVIGGKRRVTLTRLYAGRQKERDVDNLTGGMKPAVDALVTERLLVDDSPVHAEIHYLQRRIEQPGDVGLRFEIEILGE